MSETFEVYDKRDQPFYIVDDVFLKRFGKVIGPNGIAVYNALCMHSNKKTGESWPSRESIHEVTGLSVRAISTAIKQLANLKLIKVASTTGGPNHYFIQPVPEKAEPMHHVQAPTPAPRARGIARPASPPAPIATPLAPRASEQEPLTRNKNKKQEQEIAADAAEPTKSNPARSAKQERQDRILEEMILDCTGWTFQEFKARMGNALDKALGAYRPYVKNVDEAGDPEPWLLMARIYRPGGWWYTDSSGTVNFSGQQGRRPTPAGIWKSWKAWEISQPGPALKVVNGNGHARAAPPPQTDGIGALRARLTGQIQPDENVIEARYRHG